MVLVVLAEPGHHAVGKSSLVLRFVKGQFMEFQESTIGAAFLANTITLDDQTIRVEVMSCLSSLARVHSPACRADLGHCR